MKDDSMQLHNFQIQKAKNHKTTYTHTNKIKTRAHASKSKLYIKLYITRRLEKRSKSRKLLRADVMVQNYNSKIYKYCKWIRRHLFVISFIIKKSFWKKGMSSRLSNINPVRILLELCDLCFNHSLLQLHYLGVLSPLFLLCIIMFNWIQYIRTAFCHVVFPCYYYGDKSFSSLVLLLPSFLWDLYILASSW